MCDTKLIIVKLRGCEVCEVLVDIINEVSINEKILPRSSIKLLEINRVEELNTLSLNIKLFPTILAYKNNKLRLGWEGFAALAPDEIKREMVEDVLRQVAALADEDDGVGDVPHEMPQQVRHDN